MEQEILPSHGLSIMLPIIYLARFHILTLFIQMSNCWHWDILSTFLPVELATLPLHYWHVGSWSFTILLTWLQSCSWSCHHCGRLIHFHLSLSYQFRVRKRFEGLHLIAKTLKLFHCLISQRPIPNYRSLFKLKLTS